MCIRDSPGSDATVALRDVTLAARDARSVTVTSGLSAGERVVTAGVHSLTPGQAVKNPDGVSR
jgi:hypothetical protein